MILSRKEAVIFSSFIKMLSFTIEEKREEVQNALAERELKKSPIAIKEASILRKHIENKFKNYTNFYIQKFLSEKTSYSIQIEDQDVNLYTCPCCKYKTLNRIGEYDICAVCYWEDDGNADYDAFSTVNKITLREAITNFNKFGAVSKNLSKVLDPERMIKYYK